MKKIFVAIYCLLLIVCGILYFKDRGLPSYIKKLHLFNSHQLIKSSSYAEFTADIYQINDKLIIEVYSDRKDLHHLKTSLTEFDNSLKSENLDVVWEESYLTGVRIDDTLMVVPEDLLDDSDNEDSSVILSNERIVSIQILEKHLTESKEIYSDSLPHITFLPDF